MANEYFDFVSKGHRLAYIHGENRLKRKLIPRFRRNELQMDR